jgi:predicted amidohydrolase YtcJ
MSSYLLVNGDIHTMDYHGCVPAMLVVDDKVAAVGRQDAVKIGAPEGTFEIDLKGRAVYPGFHDSHIHFLMYALGLKRINLHGVATLEEGLAVIEKGVEAHPLGAWVVGAGWDKSLWGDFPTRHDLDAVSKSRPVCLSSKDGHSIWVNTKALEICGIDRDTVSPEGGAILKDSAGEPTGILQDAAESLVWRNIPETDDEEAYNAAVEAIPHLWRMGITCIHAPEEVGLFHIARRIRDEAKLPFRIALMPPASSLETLFAFDIKQGYGDDWVWTAQIKAFKDGSLGSSTALLYEPYEHLPGYYGLDCMPNDQLVEFVARSVQAGYGVAIHAIGDKAVASSLDAIEASIDESRRKRIRHRIEHAQMIHPDDIRRFKELGVIASVQPGHAVADRYMADKEWGSRSVRAYPFGQLHMARTKFAFGSDSPVEIPDVIYGLHCAVNRCLPGEGPELQWHPSENLPVQAALAGYTKDAAYAAGKEKVLGMLSPGMYADFVVLSHDLKLIPASEIGNAKVEAVSVGGRFVVDPVWM